MYKYIFLVLFPLFSFFFSASCSAASSKTPQPNVSFKTLEKNYASKFKSEFAQKGLSFPPRRMLFIALKVEKKLEIWVKEGKKWKFFTTYPILKTSGSMGPKRLSGDLQVPEGIYKISHLNPYSSFHLSMGISYPNTFDEKWAKFEGREDVGGDIFIHGDEKSIGCLAMGDQGIEELFYLASVMPKMDISVVIMPYDPKLLPLKTTPNAPSWIKYLYMRLQMVSDVIRGS